MNRGAQTTTTIAAVLILSCFEVVMVEMVSPEKMDVMDYLELKDPKDPKGIKENLVQMDLWDLKASQELGEQLDHKNLLDQLDQGVEG